ncbi:MAG: alanine dehydrogenase [Candidatus Paracaedibacteraceae bacterium]|nr:alanine dehydrogenase [Candidatus Paracaedibacteraceae bacterium]
MKIGVPKEIKIHEYRVGMTPSSVRELTSHGHTVYVEKQAGSAIDFTDEAYIKAGAQILPSAKDVFAESELIVKVKEPQESEWTMLRPDQTLFTFLHLAPDPDQARGLMASGCTAIAYETVTDKFGGLPLLAPMSEVAGRMSIQAGASYLEKAKGGRGVLLGGVAGVDPASVIILGGGVVGANAAKMAVGLGAKVTIFDKNLHRLNELDWLFNGRVQTLYSTKDAIEDAVTQADLVVGAVLVTGAAAPKLVSRSMLKNMKTGSVLVDVAIDQGGCFESSRPTTHTDPVYIEEGVVHYCVTNMPGAVARTSTLALNNATLPFIVALAQKGAVQAMRDDVHLRNGLNVFQGQITHPGVAHDLNMMFLDPLKAVA